MTNSTSQDRTSSNATPTRDGSRTTEHESRSLSASEIESLLRLSRKARTEPLSQKSDDELGPGDVQYFRGHSPIDLAPIAELSNHTIWPETQSPDSTIEHAEQHLAHAILDSPRQTAVTEPRSTDTVSNQGQISNASATTGGLTLNDLGDIDLDISIELGRAEILIEEVLKLREGSVVTLDRLAGDPVDIVANGRLVARGELLVIDGKFGVRLSEVL